MHAFAGALPNTGRPSSSSRSCAMPGTIGPPSGMPQVVSGYTGQPKSASLSEKSRKTAGTLSTHSPLILSQTGICSQSNPFSFVQVEEQPSPSAVLPSSHSSLMTRPSPQSEVQDSPAQSGSVRHSDEQPSKGSSLPSSQLSAPSTTPLPHSASLHTLGSPSHFFPSSTRQRSEQPSPGSRLPSSHRSLAATSPSPQRAISLHGSPGFAQLKPRSTCKQFLAQPSPDSVLPSSHASSEVSVPLPQPGGVGGSGGGPMMLPVPPFPFAPPIVPPPPPSPAPVPGSTPPDWELPAALHAPASNPTRRIDEKGEEIRLQSRMTAASDGLTSAMGRNGSPAVAV